MNLEEEAKKKIDTLEHIRKREDKSVPEIAEEIDTTTQTYLNWINGKYTPSLEGLSKIKNFLEE